MIFCHCRSLIESQGDLCCMTCKVLALCGQVCKDGPGQYLKGEMPVPGPTMMMGVSAFSGNLKSGFLET